MTTRIRHIKRGTTYEIIASGPLQWSAQRDLEGEIMIVYRSEKDGAVWIRPMDEIYDPTRFEFLSEVLS